MERPLTVRKIIVHSYFSLAMLGFAISFFGQLFVSDTGYGLFGAAAFLLVFLAGFVAQRKRSVMPFKSTRVWYVVVPIFIVTLLACMIFAGFRGAPQSDGLPILASRPVYNFSREKNVEAWRYLLVSVSFCIGWHSFVFAVMIELWRYWIGRSEPK